MPCKTFTPRGSLTLSVKRSRSLYVHPEANVGKIRQLEELHVEYRRYLQACIDGMISARRMKVPRGELLRFFPVERVLSTNLVLACQQHAVEIVSGWTASLYSRKIKSRIKTLVRDGKLDEVTRIALFTIGKYSVDRTGETIDQGALDLYWSLLLDPEISGRVPSVSARIGMRMSIHTSTVRKLDKTKLTSWWLGVSTLTKHRTIKLPVVANPHVKDPDEIVNGCLVRKDRRGRWRVEVLEKKLVEEPKLVDGMPRVGVDVGLNVIAATSDGRLLGGNVKPSFDKLYARVRDLRANRQRQGLKENSPRLDRLEERLTGMVRTCAGDAANKLVSAYPGHAFVIEDLDLRGCRGQKRFAYRALHRALGTKAPVVTVNPAFTSQGCPSCGYVSRSNRSGIKFQCRSCGRVSHADVVGGQNLLGRSEDQGVRLDDDPSEVRALLRERYRARRRDSSLEGLEVPALRACSRRLTVGASPRTASNAEGISRAAQ